MGVGQALEAHSYLIRTLPPSVEGLAPKEELRLLLESILVAETFHVSADICDLLDYVAPTVPADVVLQPGDLIAPAGFLWRDQALGILPPVRALQWGECRGTFDWEPAPFDRGRLGIGLFTYKNVRVPIGVTSLGFWPYGATLEQVADVWNAEHEAHPEDQKVGRDGVLAVLRFFTSLQVFVRDEVVATTRERPDRATRRRVVPHLSEQLVHVVQLRRARYEKSEPASGREYSVRFWVGGHWRNARVGPGRSQRRLTWVRPHMRGPAGKPIKALTPRVYSVRR